MRRSGPMRRARALAALVPLAALTAACGDDGTGAPDGAIPADGATSELPFTRDPPAPTAWICPDGWREVLDGSGSRVCEPWPESGRATCAADEAHFPGTPGCARIGPACPAGDFPVELPADAAILYVRAGATGGDGSETSPYGTLDGGLARAVAGTVVAVGKGRYEGFFVVPNGVVIQGACVAETHLAGPAGGALSGIVQAQGARATVRHLRLGEGAHIGLMVLNAGRTLEAQQVVVERAGTSGVFVSGGGSALLEEVVVRETRPELPDLSLGRGVEVYEGSSAELRRVLLERNLLNGVLVADPGSHATLEDVVVSESQPRMLDRRGGDSIAADTGGALTWTRLVVENGRAVGVAASGDGTTLDGRDTVIRRITPDETDGRLGMGAAAVRGGAATLRGLLVEDVHDVGCLAFDGGQLRIEDAVVRDVSAPSDASEDGFGLLASIDALADVARAHFERTARTGVWYEQRSTGTVEDVTILDTSPTPTGLGHGMQVGFEAQVTATRLLIEHSSEVGLHVHGSGTTLDASHVFVARTDGRLDNGFGGTGVHVQEGAVVTLSQLEARENRETSISLFGVGSRLDLEDAALLDTQVRTCADTTCADFAAGVGLGVFEEAHASMRSFVVLRAPLCGVMVARDGSLDLMDGEIRESTIGACVQVDDYDFSRLTTGVQFLDNGTNLEATSLPIPGAGTQDIAR